ncbi:hypothetical protein [Variovorax sp. PBL-E5]|uniref:hypothetical protein n=1 Tax=Variovorax sp. PBL-E5 TaxID=434014 RepID=UPI001316627E|nr:hypothetical protein [Variovorax sp. PBL-E5]VTU28504.1 hypothetical protein E5CHR_02622 [Variovorax sp. PBL-E5]
MQSEVQGIVQTENGPRFVREGGFEGTHVVVVTAYDINFDAWPFHVYLQQGDGPRTSLSRSPTNLRGDSMEGAFAQGMQMAALHLSPEIATFPGSVK